MSLQQKLSNLSTKEKNRWLLGIIIVFTVVVALIAGGNYYNQAVDMLADKTKGTINLPKVKELSFSLGLDLQGGTQLIYEADVSNIIEADRAGAMESVRDIIERRVNLFGVSEPLVQVNKGLQGEYQIIAELAGIKDVDEAIAMIGETPILEFKEYNLDLNLDVNQNLEPVSLELEPGMTELDLSAIQDDSSVGDGHEFTDNEVVLEDLNLETDLDEADLWLNTELTGKYLKRSTLQFNPRDGTPEISLEFNTEGAALFEEITARNVGKPVAIFLDGEVISAPTVNEKITGGQAVISGQFGVDEAKNLVKRLNSGALPVPIFLLSQKTVEASLGVQSIQDSLKAGIIGVILVFLFMLVAYRLLGFVSVLSLSVYGLTMLAIFKAIPGIWAFIIVALILALIYNTFNDLKIFDNSLALIFIVVGILLFVFALKPITLTLSGIAGLILSLGMAVDANILVFARTKEELKQGKDIKLALEEGFKRAWTSIRDGNIVVLITCLILMFFGTSSVQGFGTTLFIGVSVSLFSAIAVTRNLLNIIIKSNLEKTRFWLGVKTKQSENKIN